MFGGLKAYVVIWFWATIIALTFYFGWTTYAYSIVHLVNAEATRPIVSEVGKQLASLISYYVSGILLYRKARLSFESAGSTYWYFVLGIVLPNVAMILLQVTGVVVMDDKEPLISWLEILC
jgi:hypothetical protein